MTEGICFFAYNNNQIDYTRLAMLASVCAKRHLNKPVVLITNQGSWDWLKLSYDTVDLKHCFDEFIITDDELKINSRKHFDSPWTEFEAPFYNSNKHKVYEYSPFDKTLLLDIDYILKTDFLNHCFKSYEGVAMFDRALTLQNGLHHPREVALFDAGIPMWWSTAVYFDRSPTSKLFFDMWAHVAQHYNFYQYLYNFPGKLFRTDYCVSIAVHILNGMQKGDVINNMSDQPLFNMAQKDIILDVDEKGWLMLANDPEQNWKNIAVNHQNLDLHCMNKRSLDKQWSKLWELNR